MKKLLLPLLALAALVLPARAALPRPLAANFAYGAKLTVAGYAAGKPALTGFPVLVRIAEDSPSGFSYNNVQNKSATDWNDIDLAFIDMVGNGLPFEIDTWNPSGESLVWVRLPTMQNGTEFVMCWGSTASGRDVCADKPWGDYTGVWHLKETGGSGTTVLDSTTNALDGKTYAGSTIDGAVGAGRVIATDNNHAYGIVVDVLSDPTKKALAESLGTDFHASFWMVARAATDDNLKYGTLLCRRKGDQGYSWMVSFGGDAKPATQTINHMRVNSDNLNSANVFTTQPIGSFLKPNDSIWKKVDVVWKYATNGNDPAVDIYTNGVIAETITSAMNPNPVRQEDANIGIGGATQDNPANSTGRKGRRFNGAMDEVRLRKGAISSDWVKADYDTQTSGSFFTIGTAEEYMPTDEPIANLSAGMIQYTNASATVAVNSIGTGASSATLHVEFAENAAFAAIVTSADVSITGSGYYNISGTGLSYGTTYYVRGSITNDQNHSAMLGPISFITLTPGYPAGNGILSSPGYTTLTAQGTASEFGTGAETATMWLEASTEADFATFVAGPEVNVTVGSTTDLSVSGLSPDTAYNLRIRIRNGYELETIIPLAMSKTRAEPFAATGLLFAESAGGTIDFTFPVTGVYDGATVSAVLTYDGAGIGTRACFAAGTLSWTDVAAASGTATATIVATAMLPNDGGAFTKTWTVSVVPGATSTAVADVSAYASAENALWVRPGDVVVLPEAVGNMSYQVLNERFASVDGNALSALEPGIVGIRCVDANYTTNIMGVIVLPDPIGSGSVYVFKETALSVNAPWCSATSWDKVQFSGGTASRVSSDSYPKNADDIAILPFYTQTGSKSPRHTEDITIGSVYIGMIRPDVRIECAFERATTPEITRTVTFRRTDGEPVRVQVCPNGFHSDYQTQFRLGGFTIDVVWASDAVIDCGSSETSHTSGPVGTFMVNSTTVPCTNTLLNAKLTIQGLPGRYMSGNGCTKALNGVWRGTGEIIKKGWGGIVFPDDFSQFEGTIRELSGPQPADMGSTAAGVLMRAAGASNVAAHVYGWAAYSHNNGAMSYNGLSQGALGTGGSGVAPEFGAQGPSKGLYMHGGTYRANAIDKTGWGVGGKDEKVFDVLSVDAGLSYISLETGKGNGSGKPINAVIAKTLAQTGKGTLVIYDNSCNNAPGTDVTNVMFSVREWADHAVGAAADPLASDVYPIIPWIVFNRSSDFNNISFATFDASGRLVKSYSENTEIDAVTSEDSNAYVNSKSINRNSSTKPNLVMRSLFLNDSGKTRTLGAGRTLTITSGGLVLHGSGSSIGLPNGGADNGSLVLGDAKHPAYVYAKSFGNSPNEIWATTTAAGGFVKSWTGNLVLGGTQTGIASEIVVNGGSLSLGNESKDCELAEGLPVRVCAGAALKLPYAGTIANSPLKIDGSGGTFGMVELAADQTCASLSVRDVFESEEWTTLPAGTYGASGSGAEFVRDDLFVGTGMLTVGDVAPTTNMMLLIW